MFIGKWADKTDCFRQKVLKLPLLPSFGGDFDARPLSFAEKRFLQAALAYQGHYQGMIDGSWGSRSQGALEGFTEQEFEREPTNADAALAGLFLVAAAREDGWDYQYFDALGVSVAMPMGKMMLEKRNGSYANWQHKTKNLSVIVDDLSFSDIILLHMDQATDPRNSEAPYTVRTSKLWVTSSKVRGATFYQRSELVGGTWATIFIGAGTENFGELALISGSITVGRAPRFLPSTDGLLFANMRSLAEEFKEDDTSEAPETATPRLGSNSDQRQTDEG